MNGGQIHLRPTDYLPQRSGIRPARGEEILCRIQDNGLGVFLFQLVDLIVRFNYSFNLPQPQGSSSRFLRISFKGKEMLFASNSSLYFKNEGFNRHFKCEFIPVCSAMSFRCGFYERREAGLVAVGL